MLCLKAIFAPTQAYTRTGHCLRLSKVGSERGTFFFICRHILTSSAVIAYSNSVLVKTDVLIVIVVMPTASKNLKAGGRTSEE